MFDNLTEELLLTLKYQNSFLICKTFFPEKEHDRLEKFRKFISEEWFCEGDIPHGFKIDKKVIRHIFDAHGYDSELGIWVSIRFRHIVLLLDILENYDTISIYDANRLRFLLRKTYDNMDYYTVVEVDHTNPRSSNQLKLITMYVNDSFWVAVYERMKHSWPNAIAKARKEMKQALWDRFISDDLVW